MKLLELKTCHGEVVTARNLGHSEAVLHRHYRALVTPAQARTFFEIVPRFKPTLLRA